MQPVAFERRARHEDIGYNAAALLNEMLQGRVPPAEAPRVSFASRGRQSTDVVAICRGQRGGCRSLYSRTCLRGNRGARRVTTSRFRQLAGRPVSNVWAARPRPRFSASGCNGPTVAAKHQLFARRNRRVDRFGYPANLSDAFGTKPTDARPISHRHRAISRTFLRSFNDSPR